MDARFQQTPINASADFTVIWHPYASFEDIRNGYDAILASVLASGGSGYAVGDIFKISGGQGNVSDATGSVTTVDGGGAVLTYTMINFGTEYVVGIASTIANSGVGVGLTINITSVGSEGIDLSPFVSKGNQSAFEATITLNWDFELFGAGQPTVNSIIEIITQGQTLWMGIIDSISQYTISRGERQMELTCKTRDSLNLWRQTKRVSTTYPQLTNVTQMMTDVCQQALGLFLDEIVLNASVITAVHSSTQMAGISAWDMLTVLMQACGQAPFVDGLARIRTASRDLLAPNIVLTDDRVVRVNASRNKTPITRFRLKWLDPSLSKSIQPGKKLNEVVVTFGWYLPYWQKEVWFSADKTQRAEATYMRTVTSVNGLFINGCIELYTEESDTAGLIQIINPLFGPALVLLGLWIAAHYIPDGVAAFVTIPNGRIAESFALGVFILLMMSIGNGVYEIWGNPFDWVHARNTTEAFDQNSPGWVDTPVDVENDLIMNQAHSNVVAVRELTYRAAEVNKWSASIVDDPRIEYGDIIQFSDGSIMYVENFTRSIERTSNSVLEVSGFLTSSKFMVQKAG